MAYKSEVWITTSFEGFHCWPEAFDSVSFLRDRHRHIFHVKITLPVSHSDRDVEFIHFKQEVNKFIRQCWPNGELGRTSCEELGETLLEAFPFASRVEISEDLENGATVYRN